MNEILVGVDFSSSSLNAFEHAIGLAHKYNSFLLAVWVETKESVRLLDAKAGADAQQKAKARFDELIASYGDQFASVETQLKLRKGTSYKEILEEAKAVKPDMIITGTHGSRGFRKYFLGDNANSIYGMAECPVISISEHRKATRNLDTIIMPVDNSLDTRQKVPLVTSLAKKYGAEVHVLGMVDSNLADVKMRVNLYVKQVMAHFYSAKVPCKTKIIQGGDRVKNVLNYAKNSEANLIAIMVRQSGDGSNPFLSSKTQQLINQAPMPVLTVPNKEIIKERPGR
jgi:nucleotide-binding universal stress UspA family protein